MKMDWEETMDGIDRLAATLGVTFPPVFCTPADYFNFLVKGAEHAVKVAKEAALWRKVIGRNDPEALDFELGRAGIDYHFKVLIEMRDKAQAERDAALAKLADETARATRAATERNEMRIALGEEAKARLAAEAKLAEVTRERDEARAGLASAGKE